MTPTDLDAYEAATARLHAENERIAALCAAPLPARQPNAIAERLEALNGDLLRALWHAGLEWQAGEAGEVRDAA